MKTRFPFLILLATLTGVDAAPPEAEARALEILKSAAPVAEKEAACLRLKQIGTAQCVPALKALIADENLAQWAVDALQTLPAREAGEALLRAQPEASGRTKALVAFALGVRQEVAAVPALGELLGNSDTTVAVAAVGALGRIGGEAALTKLLAARSTSTGTMRTAVNNALLMSADRSLATGDKAKAQSLYKSLRTPTEPPQVHGAAFRGLVLSGGGASAVVSALLGADEAEQVMAVQLLRDLPDRDATPAFAAVLPKLSPLLQVALLEALRQRGDPVAAADVAALTRSGDSAVRGAAIKALGELGDATHVGLLAGHAASGPGGERSEARQALATLHRGAITPAMLSEVQRADAPVQLELVQALARRMDRSAVPDLLRLAAAADSKLAVVSIQALEKLADDSRMEALLELIVHARDGERRDAAVSAYAAVGGRGRNAGEFGARALLAMDKADVAGRCALLDAAAQVGGPGVAEALRVAVRDANAEVRAAAVRAMAESAGEDARADLLKLAQEAATATDREMALRGYWRLVEGMGNRDQPERFAAVRDGLAAGKTPADLKLGLARLSELQSAEALDAALRYRGDVAVRMEADAACLAIASRLEGADVEAAEKALNALATTAEAERIRAEAKAAAAKLDARKGFLAPWLVSGPYRQEGREAQQLFDVVFAPEPPDASQVRWRALTGAGPTVDLLPVAGGNHCIVYLKTRVYCPKEQPVALEIGTDDGVKLWINGALVHANNAVRGFTPGEDKAQATLQEGWNECLLKVTQHTAGCAASVRVRTADGKSIPGLQIEAKE